LEEFRILAAQVDRHLAQNSGLPSDDIGVDGEAFGRGRLANHDFESILEIIPNTCELDIEA
jgi:hypothetical protein